MINASEFRTTVRFERKERTSDGAGGFTEEWATIEGAPTKAKVVALSGNERLEAARLSATTKQRLTCRYFPLLEADRVVIESRTYNITFLDDVDRRKKWLVIDLSGGVST